MKQLMKIFRQASGFSMVEMLAVMFVVNFALLGIISLSIQAVQVERFNKNILVAAQLAQEGVELIRNQRDSQWLINGSVFLPSGNYALDYAGNVASGLAGIADNGTKLYVDAQGHYSHDTTGSSTAFRRLITLNSATAASTTLVSWVRFSDGTATKDYKIETLLYDWR